MLRLAASQLCVLVLSILLVVLPPALAQSEGNPATSSASQCLFSCPELDLQSWPLVKRPWTIGWDSYYSIFECVYAIRRPNPTPELTEHKCSYDKNLPTQKQSGLQRLAAAGDNCPPQAVPCPPTGSSEPQGDGLDAASEALHAPKFSNQESDETPPWVENGRFLLWMSEHPPA
ncbi:hypothetical protein CVT26_011605 [Gymnopilus dilepis]|uniref:Uncharacterized protein n=1 Tax=Gymnopilus dilepis TaxID=231916 RepID=A0A409YQR5_9AGAR|nr:hypothetical protein CVT26_011605 [Gymnopilus dilepis]